MARATIKDVARQSGWSLGTVSRVINDEPGVSRKARADVLLAIEKLGYQRNPYASSLRSHKADRIDLVIASSLPYYWRLAQALLVQLEGQKHTVRLVNLVNKQDQIDFLAQSEQNSHPRAIVFLGARTELIKTTAGRMKIPALCVGEPLKGSLRERFSSLSLADSALVLEGVEWLFARGCCHIGVLMADRFSSVEMANRFLGVQYAFYSRNTVLAAGRQAEFVMPTFEGGYQGFRALIERMPSMDGLFVADAAIAAGALRAAADMHIEIGRQLMVLCLDETGLSSYTIPRLSAFVRDLDKEAALAADLVRDGLAGQIRHVASPWEMVWQESFPRPLDCTS